MILQQWLARLFNNHWHECSTVASTIVQQSLARLFNSRWHNSSTVTGTIVQQSLAGLFNSGWHDCSTVTGTNVQQSLARLINSHWHDSSTATGTILQQSLTRFFNSHWQNYLQQQQILALQKKGFCSGHMTPGNLVREEIFWWIENLKLFNERKIQQREPHMTIWSDRCLNKRLGAYSKGICTGRNGKWSKKGNRFHINVLEWLVLKFAIVTFTKNTVNATETRRIFICSWIKFL